MKRQVFLFKFLGSGWLALGMICLALGGSHIGGVAWDSQVDQVLPGDVLLLWQTLYRPPITVVALMWGAVCVVLGWNLVRLANWAQPLAQAVHLLLAVYLALGLMVGLAVAPEASEALAVTVLLLAGNLSLAYLLRGRLASEVFSYLPLRTAPIVSRRCEFCDSALDLQTGRCPECEPSIKASPRITDGDQAKPALVAQLVSQADGTLYPLSSQRPTLVGRELSRNDINLNNPTVSRQHARIEYDIQNSHYTLIAMQDTNGTFVNDKLLRQRPLRDGDEVRFGRAKFRFRIVTGMEQRRADS